MENIAYINGYLYVTYMVSGIHMVFRNEKDQLCSQAANTPQFIRVFCYVTFMRRYKTPPSEMIALI